MILKTRKMVEFIRERFGRRQGIKNISNGHPWQMEELKNINKFISNGSELRVKFSKTTSMYGTLKLGDEVIPVYLMGIDIKEILPDPLENIFLTKDGDKEIKKPDIVRKFILKEIPGEFE